MNKLIIYTLIITNITLAQNTNKAEKLLEKVHNQLIKKKVGSCINFTYSFKNDAYEMNHPIQGKLSLFSKERFHLEFNTDQNKMIQIYNGENLKTILPEEKEIQIDKMEKKDGLVIQSVFNNYKADFNASIQTQEKQITTIKLTPKKVYNEIIFNNCIDTLGLPKCLKLPHQCKIGLSPTNQKLLNHCLDLNKGYKKTDILEVEIQINESNLQLISIKQSNRYNAEIVINVSSIEEISQEILNINQLYKDFEIVDLR